ncbi:CapA family protein [Tessaracoccus oleiagri]|nr:CapA family protein [Tessaracoccus oleiagri]
MSSPSPTPTPAPTEPRRVTINVSGDLLWHDTLWRSAELDGAAAGGGLDFYPMLASLQSLVSEADLAICHAEVPFAPAGGPFSDYPLFAAPQEVAVAVAKVGWDVCTTASNHTLDQGWEGLVRTLDVHRAAGILTAGSHATREESEKPTIITTDEDVAVCIVSQTYGLNGIPKPEGREWAVDLLDADVALEDAARCRAAGADIVAVHIHAGDEYRHEPNAQQRDFVAAVTASDDVDFVFGQHAHVVQPIDRVNGKWVVYGAGNLIAQSGPAQPATYDGYLAEVTFAETPQGFEATAMRWAPTLITKQSGARPARVYLIPEARARVPALAEAMEQSAARTRAVVTSLGPEGLVEIS